MVHLVIRGCLFSLICLIFVSSSFGDQFNFERPKPKPLPVTINIPGANTAQSTCSKLLKNTVKYCCDVPANSISTTRSPQRPQVKEEVFQCPEPREDIIYRVKCIETPYADQTFARINSREETRVTKLCHWARSKYEANCSVFKPAACPSEIEYSEESLKMYPLCSQLRQFWYGPEGKDAIACNPLGEPDPNEFPEDDFIPNYSGEDDNPEIPTSTQDPEGSDDEETSDTPTYDDIVEPLPEGFDDTIGALRLEIPGSFVRYQAVSNFIRPMMSVIGNRSGIECSESDLSCKINPLSIKKNENDRYPFLIEYLRSLSETRPNIISLATSPYSSNGEEQNGLSIKRFIYGFGAVDDQDYDEAIAGVLLDGITQDNLTDTILTSLGGFVNETFQMRVGWTGSINLFPDSNSQGVEDVVRFNLKDEASLKWIPMHKPMAENGYLSNFEKDAFIDQSKIIFGLDPSSCHFLRDFQYLEENSSTYINANGRYYAYQNSYFCSCDPAVSSEDFRGNPDRINFCVFDPYQKEKDISVTFKYTEHVSLFLNGSNNIFAVIPVVKTVKLPLFKNSQMEKTKRALEYHQQFLAYGEYENYTYNRITSTLEGTPVTYRFNTFLEYRNAVRHYSELASSEMSLDDALAGFNEGQLQPVRGSNYVSNNTRNSIIFDQNIATAHCVENDREINFDQRQFSFGNRENELVTYDELRYRENLNNYFDFTDASQKSLALWAVNYYGCAQTKLTKIELDSTSSDGQNYVTSAAGIETNIKSDLGKYIVEVESHFGNPGVIWIDLGLSASLEQKMQKKWWLNIFRWIIKIIFKLISAVLSFVSTIVTWVVYGVLGSDYIGFDLGDIKLKGHHAISHLKPVSDLGETLSHQLRRISVTVPEVTINSFSNFEFDAPSCNIRENFSQVSGPISFFQFLLRTIVGCPIETFRELIGMMLTPIQNFFLDIVDYFFDATNLLIQTINNALIPEMDLYGHNDLIDFLHDAQKFQFNPNFNGGYDNPLASSPDIDPNAGNFLQTMCSLGQTPELTCLATQLLTNPKLGDANVKGCLKRIGGKTHDQSMDDLRGLSYFEESYDFPPVRFCDTRDRPRLIDRVMEWSSDDGRSYFERLKDFDEIDQIPFEKDTIGYKNQCASFYDIKFVGVAKFLSSEDERGEKHIIEFLPSKRTNFLINKVFLCEDSFSCSTQNPVIKLKAKVAGCSMIADMWYHHVADGNVVDSNPSNLLDFFTNTSPRVAQLRATFLLSYNQFYCSQVEDPEECREQMREFIESITEKANFCKGVLTDLGSGEFTYQGRGSVLSRLNETCKDAY